MPKIAAEFQFSYIEMFMNNTLKINESQDNVL